LVRFKGPVVYHHLILTRTKFVCGQRAVLLLWGGRLFKRPDQCWLRSKAAPPSAHRGRFDGSAAASAAAGRRTRIWPDLPIRRKTGRPQVPVMPPSWLYTSHNRAQRKCTVYCDRTYENPTIPSVAVEV